ncbi:unnamed protein product [Darwinula stevensoni]|uniref:PRELI/MSF1 domain-containing protein n=1 Tax=Darwinula stevensoni TaxID=69355 RepID=A0A7R8X2W4_9CRUS|nr:unnamed protein product [Darwinula stevensoni]CAG0883854.1 unnamed protein product [Darwinula stevensoni]
MKIWTSEHVFNHPWETVAQAAWRKYPNPMNPAVIGIDVLDRKVDNGVLCSHRLLSSSWGFPFWAQNIVGAEDVCYASELSKVDPRKKIFCLKTHNVCSILTFMKNLAVDESLVYCPHPEDSGKTLLKQEAVVTVKGVPLTSYLESILTGIISSNANKGRQAMEWVIGHINSEVQELTHCADDWISKQRLSIDAAFRDYASPINNQKV